MHVSFLDLSVSGPGERQALLSAIDTVLRHGRMVLGPEVEAFESRMARACNRSLAVGVGSGTDALFLTLRASGLDRGDEVITTPLSWVSTANAIVMAGGVPVFADIGPDLNLDPASVEPLITKKTRIILPVHYTGRVCEMKSILAMAERYGLTVVEDAAQAFLASRGGQPAGSFGHAACFSMNPMKVLAAIGEAGVVVTDSAETAERIRSLRYSGTVDRERCIVPSLNARLDTIQAAILLHRMESVGALVQQRRRNAERYNEMLAGVVQTPLWEADEHPSFYTYQIQCDERDALKAYLDARDIETRIQHKLLIPQQPAYREIVQGAFPHAKMSVKRILCLPVHEKLSMDQIEFVAQAVLDFHEGRK